MIFLAIAICSFCAAMFALAAVVVLGFLAARD